MRVDDHGAGQLDDNNTVLSATGVVGNAADFEASNSEYLSAALTNMGASPGDKDLTVVGWFRLESKGATRTLKSVDRGTTAGRSWRLEYNTTNDRFRFIAFGASNAVVGDVYANNLGSPSTATDYFIEAWHSATDNEVGIRVNNGTADTAATTGAMVANNTSLWFGAIGSGGSGSTPASFHDGLTDESAIWRRLLTADERTQLYNSGSGYGWSNWFTDSGIEPLHVAHYADVLAYDATAHTYEVTLNVTQTGRHAIGVMMLQSADGKQLRLSIGGSAVETITVDDDNLANKTGSYFEDGFVYDFTTTGSKTIKVESVGSTFTIRGVIVREPDSVSGIVEDQGTGTHCEPLQCAYGGSTYSVHVEMYSGDVYLCKDGVLQGLVFSGLSADRNERYHYGCAVVPLAAGVAVIAVGHNQNGLRVRYLPGGVYGSITSTYTTLSSTPLTYCKSVVLADDRIAVLTRGGSTQSPLLVLLSSIDEIDGTGASGTSDWIFNGTGAVYPNALELYTNGSTEVLACLFNSRSAGNDWGSVHAVLFCPQEGSVGEWYALDGTDSTVTGSRGTEGTPRFNSTMQGALTGSGGMRVLGELSAGQQRYALSGIFKVTQWPSGATPAKGAVLISFVDSPGAINAYNDSAAVRFAIQNEATLTLDSSFNELPTDAELKLTTNNYRLDATFMWEGDDDTADALLAITDRRWGKTGSGKGTTYEECGPYYDWGAHQISVLRITNPHTPGSIAFSQEKRIEVEAQHRAAFITKAGTNSIVYQPGDNQLHMTHRQTTRRSASLLAASAAPTITALSAIGITATSAQPRISYS